LAFHNEGETRMNATTNETARQRKPRAKPQRFVGLVVKPGPNFAGVLRITVGRETADYVLTEVPSDIGGRGFRVEKVGAEEGYYVLLGSPTDDGCTCKGFQKWSHCKHHDGLAALIAAGRL
jgi:hypothetical protein